MASEAPAAQSIGGVWYAPHSSRAAEATLRLEDDTRLAARDETGAVLASDAFADVKVSDRVGSIPRRIAFADGSVFETTDNDGIDRLLAPFAGRGSGIVHSLERFHPRLAVFVVLVMLLAVGIYRYAVPILVEVAVLVTPPVVPELLSSSTMATLDSTLFEPSKLDAETQKDIADGFEELAAASGRGSSGYSLNFRKGGAIGPNAFALPDGTIVLTDELVEMANDRETVLGVLAHEIGHVDHEHSLRQIYRAAGVTGLILLIGGDVGSGVEDILIQGSALVSLSYTRDAEAEADRFSVELMHRTGHDPFAIARFLELIRDKLGDTSENDFLSTHPATPARIEETKRYAEELAGSPAN